MPNRGSGGIANPTHIVNAPAQMPGSRGFGGITIGTGGRPGGVPTHIVDAPTQMPGTQLPVAHVIGGSPATWNPMAGITRLRKALGRRLS